MPDVPPTTTDVRPARETVIRETPWLERESGAEADQPRSGGAVARAQRRVHLPEGRGAEVAAGVGEVRGVGHVEGIHPQLEGVAVVGLDALDDRRVQVHVA